MIEVDGLQSCHLAKECTSQLLIETLWTIIADFPGVVGGRDDLVVDPVSDVLLDTVETIVGFRLHDPGPPLCEESNLRLCLGWKRKDLVEIVFLVEETV